MAERTLNTRIKLRYASYAEWQNSSVKLLPGELAVCYIEANNTEIKNTAPTVLFKVGDGEHVFKDLKWSSARAADVYDWAKAESRPEYSKADVGLGLVRNVEGYAKTETYSKEEVNAKIEEIQGALEADTNTTYRFDLSVANQITIYSKNIGAEEVKVGTFAVDFGALVEEINGVKGRLSAVESGKADKTQLADYYTKTEIEGKGYLTEHQDISGKADKTYVDQELGKKVDSSSYTEDMGTINGKISGIEGDIDSLEGRMTTVEGKFDNYATSAYVSEQLALKANKAEVEEDILEINNKFNSYYDKDAADGLFMTEGEVDARINKIISDAVDGDTLTSLTELVQYINTHGGEAAEMAAAIKVLEGKLEGIDSTVAESIRAAIEELNISQYAKADELSALDGRVGEISERVGALESVTVNLPTLETTVAGHDTAINDLSASLGTLDGTVYSLSETVGTIEGDYLKNSDKSDLMDAISTESGRVDELVNTTIPGLDSRIYELEGKPFDSYAEKDVVEGIATDLGLVDGRLSEVEADYLKAQDKADVVELINNEKTRAEAAELALSNRVKNVEDNYLSASDVIIWDCGGAN